MKPLRFAAMKCKVNIIRNEISCKNYLHYTGKIYGSFPLATIQMIEKNSIIIESITKQMPLELITPTYLKTSHSHKD